MASGGSGAQIAPVRRMAMRLDDHYDLVAGVLSSSPVRSLLEGERLGLPRVYRTIEDMLRLERERPDPIDIVVVVTPNDAHYSSCMAALAAAYHVICDKPLANTLAEAKTIERKVAGSGLKFCVTYNYSGYAQTVLSLPKNVLLPRLG
jgi:predicted dehydrogenase